MAAREMCVVVLSFRNELTVLDAVDSLLEQSEELEIVVAHSGGGRTPRLLQARPEVKVTSTAERWLPGAARNAGMRITSAPYVAFLAADCVATRGWAAARMRRHRQGTKAVASALLPTGETFGATAAWLATHGPRVPAATPGYEGLQGVSYSRELLNRFGPYREDVLIGEDSELNRSIEAAGIEIVWAPEVITLHRYPSSAAGAVADGFRRGTRLGVHLGPVARRRYFARVPAAFGACLRRGLSVAAHVPSRRVLGAAPLVALVWAAKVAGLVAGERRAR